MPPGSAAQLQLAHLDRMVAMVAIKTTGSIMGSMVKWRRTSNTKYTKCINLRCLQV